jgi:hypothetical protein
MSEPICVACNQPIRKDQYLYKVKLDDGKIVFSHGYPCIEQFKIDRPKPITTPDWWVQRVLEWERV